MRRVLFLEPDEQVGEGLRRSLRAYSQSWSMRFVPSVAEAEALLEETDVVVVDGLSAEAEALLTTCKLMRPTIARAALAPPDARPETFARFQALSHQVLRKPLLPTLLYDLVERTLTVIERLSTDRLRTVVGQLGDLPPLPATYSRISQMTQDPEVPMDAVAAVVERDPAITAAVLRIINSAYFGLPRRVSSVRETVRYLGIVPLKNLVLTVEIFEGLAQGKRALALQQEALLRAYAMRDLLGRTPMAEQAFIAGVLSDVGQLLLVSKLPVDAVAIERIVEGGVLPWQAQEQRLGCSAATIGAALLARWNLPNGLVEAVALHHDAPAGPVSPTVATGLALVSALEWSLRAPPELRSEFRKGAQHLVGAFPSASLESLSRYFGPGDAAVA